LHLVIAVSAACACECPKHADCRRVAKDGQ
jgi:hypothetical protein